MADLSAHDRAVLTAMFNPTLPLFSVLNEATLDIRDEEEDSPETRHCKEMERDGIQKAESGDLDGALRLFNNAINSMPGRASLYNNRAQVFQFKGQLEDAFSDLNTAISYCTDNLKKTKCQIYCQRGLLHRKKGRDNLARDDFKVAADLGSAFAKSQLVEMNPYAAMCNQIMQKMIQTECGSQNGENLE